MGFRLTPKSMTLDDLELDGGRPPLFSLFTYLNQHNSDCMQHRDIMLGSRVAFPAAELRFSLRGHHTRTAVARTDFGGRLYIPIPPSLRP